MPAPPRRDRSRSLVLAAADAAFREKRLEAVAMGEIAQRAGLTRKTLYNLFDSKEDIVHALVAASEDESCARYRARMAAGEDALKLLGEAFVESAQWCLANPSIAPLALAGPREGLALHPPPGRDSFHSLIVDMMALGQMQGALRGDLPAQVLASALLGAFANTMRCALTGAPFELAWIAGLVRLSIEGLGAHADRRAAK